jgi:hypothetical protein
LHRNCAIDRIKTFTISKTTFGKYFAFILIDSDYETIVQIQALSEDKIIGIDAGMIKSYCKTKNSQNL